MFMNNSVLKKREQIFTNKLEFQQSRYMSQRRHKEWIRQVKVPTNVTEYKYRAP